jgi:hypothetical protein
VTRVVICAALAMAAWILAASGCAALGDAIVSADNADCASYLGTPAATWYDCNIRSTALPPTVGPGGIIWYTPQDWQCGILFCASSQPSALADAAMFLGNDDAALRCESTQAKTLTGLIMNPMPTFDGCVDPQTEPGPWGALGATCWFGNGMNPDEVPMAGTVAECCEPAICEPVGSLWETNYGACCITVEGACKLDTDCCSFQQGFQGCVDGACSCVPLGSPCADVRQCCTDSTSCDGRCCQDTGEYCVQDADCCNGASCDLNSCGG